MRIWVAMAFIIWFTILFSLPLWLLKGVLLGGFLIIVLLLLLAVALFAGFWWDEGEWND